MVPDVRRNDCFYVRNAGHAKIGMMARTLFGSSSPYTQLFTAITRSRGTGSLGLVSRMSMARDTEKGNFLRECGSDTQFVARNTWEMRKRGGGARGKGYNHILVCGSSVLAACDAVGSVPFVATGGCRFKNHVAIEMRAIIPVSIQIRCQRSCWIR